MTKSLIQLSIALFILFISVCSAAGHCEIRCGIYGDKERVNLISEHITTIEKSMREILKLQEEKPLNHNQITRWVMNKERHATEIQVIVSQYFMTQRIKHVGKKDRLEYSKYVDRLALLHKLLIYAMKAKQTTDLEYVKKLKKTLTEFESAYFGMKRSKQKK